MSRGDAPEAYAIRTEPEDFLVEENLAARGMPYEP